MDSLAMLGFRGSTPPLSTNNSKKIKVMETKIKTMDELADIINDCDDYPNAIVDAAIKANGWKDEQGEIYGICSSDTEVLEFNESAIAVVR